MNNAQFGPLIAVASAKSIFDQLKSGADSGLQNKGTTTYKGQSVVAIDDGTKNGTLYVAANRDAVSGGAREDGLERRQRSRSSELEPAGHADGADGRARLLAPRPLEAASRPSAG